MQPDSNAQTSFQAITAEASRVLHQHVTIDQFNAITRIEKTAPWSDAVANTPGNQKILDIDKDDKANAYISKRLAHIIVNPSVRKTDAKTLSDCYVYSPNSNAVNCSESSVRKVVKELCVCSKRNREAHLAEGEEARAYYTVRDSTKILHGSRGVGKTFLLNHILAKYSPLLDKRRTIWVRLNLVDDFGDNQDMIWWIYAQATKIILRYYCKDSNRFDKRSRKSPIDVVGPIGEYIQRQAFEALRLQTMKELQEILDVFVYNDADEPISPSLIPKILARQVWDIAARAGYSFITVLDGLDRLESTSDSYRKFMDLITQLHKLVGSSETFPSSFVIVCRTKTAEALANAQSFFPFESNDIPRLEVGEVGFRDVLDRRIDFFLSQMHAERNKPGDFAGANGDQLKGFRTYIEKDIRDFSIFGKNMRASMQTVQVRHKEYVRFGLGGGDHHDYRLVESCIRMGWKYPPRIYKYEFTPENQTTVPYTCIPFENAIDNRLLVSVFSYPYIDYKNNPKYAPDFKFTLLGLRILQLAKVSDDLHASKMIRKRITVEFLCDLLTECFSYAGKISRTVLREFSEFELLNVDHELLVDTNVPIPTSEVSITAKGRHILDRCVSDVAYLSLCAMRIPMRSSVLVNDKGFPFFTARSYPSSNLSGWINAKVINSINLFKLLEHLDARQAESVQARRERIAEKYFVRGVPGASWKQTILHDFAAHLGTLQNARREILSQITGIVGSVAGVGKFAEHLQQALSANNATWWPEADRGLKTS